jgi:26S proteasome regulatory subunit N5
MMKNGNVSEAFDKLLSVEKQSRTAGDALSTGRILKAIVQLSFDLKDWDLLNEHIVLLSKRRNQLKTAVASMVEECCKFVNQTPDKETKLKLISTLRTVTEGKIYVEVPRARLTMELAKITEADGDVSKAAEILQELQVETYGSMDREEKVLFIIEQMRLCLLKKDVIRAQIISKKISTKFFINDTSETAQDLKLRYYNLMIEMCLCDKSYLEICRHYRAIFDTPKIQENETAWKEALKNSVIYVLLAPHNNEQSDLLHRLYEEKKLQQIPVYKNLMECFRRRELLNWKEFQEMYTAILREGTPEEPCTGVFSPDEQGNQHWNDFHKKLIEHNLRVIALYYTRISMKRLSELVTLSQEECEKYLSELVTNKTIYARIDRPAGIVNFVQNKDPSEILNDWSNNLTNLMTLVTKTTHLINKEEMIHRLVK